MTHIGATSRLHPRPSCDSFIASLKTGVDMIHPATYMYDEGMDMFEADEMADCARHSKSL